jgi:hypothetical protein
VPLPGEHSAGVRKLSGKRAAAGLRPAGSLNVHPAAGRPLPSQPSGANAPLGANGCTYPTDVPTLFNQFNAAGVSWKGYAQDIGGEQVPGATQFQAHSVVGREDATCAGPGASDNNPDTNLLEHHHRQLDRGQ